MMLMLAALFLRRDQLHLISRPPLVRVSILDPTTSPTSNTLPFVTILCIMDQTNAIAFAAPLAFTTRSFSVARNLRPKRRLLFPRSRRIRLTQSSNHQVSPVTISMALPDVPKNSLTVLVVGSGGREHALVNAVAKSPYLNKLIAAPGSAAISTLAECVPISVDDIDAIAELAVSRQVSLVVVGPEVPLVAGLVDRVKEKGILAFGPSSDAAVLEGSKVFTKAFLERHSIPTAWYQAFTNPEQAKSFIRAKGAPIVVKADGLAAGKGVILAKTVEDATKAVDAILVDGQFGSAGREIVVEEFLTGEELSFFALLDGETALPLASAQDHKAAYDRDTGPNTGGMGAYSPAPVCDDAMKEQIMNRVVLPTMRGMRDEGREFSGVLYCGMMVDESGHAKVLEYNVRFGDPECQVLCERMRSDMLELLYRTAQRKLMDFELEWDPLSAVVVVLATSGYPGSYMKGSVIKGIEKADAIAGVKVYHAGTSLGDDKQFVASGGRVLGVTATGKTIGDAQRTAYEGVDAIDWPEGFCRRDIGWRAIAREQQAAAPAKLLRE